MALVRVKYVGLSDVRIMSKADLAAVGVHVDGPLTWDSKGRANGGVLAHPNNLTGVYIEDMSEELEALLRAEAAFTIEEVDEVTGKAVKTIVKGTHRDDTGATVKDGNTGEVSVKPPEAIR